MRPDRQPDLFYSAVHLFPQNRNHPLIVVIHGGPHSAFTTKFSSAYEFLQRLDYGLLLVNYRGSTGKSTSNKETTYIIIIVIVFIIIIIICSDIRQKFTCFIYCTKMSCLLLKEAAIYVGFFKANNLP